MLFNSISFLIFFPIVVVLYYTVPQRYTWLVLTAASCYFYISFFPPYIFLLLFAAVNAHIFARLIATTESAVLKKYFLSAGLAIAFGLLFFYKYFNFFMDILSSLRGGPHMRTINLVLPIGISFFTFQATSYIIDVYRDKLYFEPQFRYFFLFKAFFPQLVAGPIERKGHLLPQLKVKNELKYENVVDGLKIAAVGFTKKVVIADRLAAVVDTVYNNVDASSGNSFNYLIATVFFSFQIYCDFSGYTDIAIGVAKVLGVNLVTNFKQPYFAKSINEFWKRWHVSLTSWFRDYLYKPLGGSRVSMPRTYANVLVVFLVSGLWHGANYTFVVWGLFHGIV